MDGPACAHEDFKLNSEHDLREGRNQGAVSDEGKKNC